MISEPPEHFRDFAHAAIDAGFDVIHGHSAHLFQGIEIYRGRPIFYDTGDFIDDYRVDERLRNDWSFVFLVDVEDKRIQRVRLIPVRLNYARADLATDREATSICKTMAKRCAAFGTDVSEVGATLAIPVEQRVIA